MHATRFEFRFRVPIIVGLYAIGLFAPWQRLFPEWNRGETWGLLIAQLNRTGLISFSNSFVVVNVVALIVAFSGAFLRLWATACIGAPTMASSAMLADKIVAAGPYRYLRNPLYLAAWLLAVPVALLMKPAGAAFLIAALAIFLLRLAAAEQAYLSARLGDAYRQYRESVPALVPKVAMRPAASEAAPEWLRAAVAESYGVLLAVSFAAFCWSFNGQLLRRCAIISFGASLLLNAASPPLRAPSPKKAEVE